MHDLPPLNSLRAFEAAARHLSLTKAAAELNVSPGAISHQIRGLEALLGVQLFERRVRAIVLTAAGKLLYPGMQTGFLHLREAVAGLKQSGTARVLVVSTPPGLTAKWLAPRLYRFANAHPEVDTRISSSLDNAKFTTGRSCHEHAYRLGPIGSVPPGSITLMFRTDSLSTPPTMHATPQAKAPACCWRRTFLPMIICVVAGW